MNIKNAINTVDDRFGPSVSKVRDLSVDELDDDPAVSKMAEFGVYFLVDKHNIQDLNRIPSEYAFLFVFIS